MGLAQDRIYTIDGDTIDCKINHFIEGNLYYSQTKENKISHNSIAEIDVTSYEKGGVRAYVEEEKDLDVNTFESPLVRIGVGVAAIKRTAPLSDELPQGLKDHYSKLTRGRGYSGDVFVFIDEQNAVGGWFIHSSYKAEIDGAYIDSAGVILHGPGLYRDEVKITTFGPTYAYKLSSKNERNLFLFKVGFSYVKFEQTSTLEDYYLKVWGSSGGMLIGVDYNYRIDPTFGVGAYVNLETGVIANFSYDDGTTVRKINLGSEYGENVRKLSLGISGTMYF